MSDKATFKIEIKRSNLLMYFYYFMLLVSIIWTIGFGVELADTRGASGYYSEAYGMSLPSNTGVVNSIQAGAYFVFGSVFIHLFSTLIYKERFKREIKGMTTNNP